MSCRFAHDDGAYVLGALSPGERLEFERHLARCEECTRTVGELAGLPGLLGRVDPAVVEDSVVDEPPPATLLPALSREVRRVRRRRTSLAVGLAAAAVVAAVVAVAAAQLGGEETTAPAPPGVSPTVSEPTGAEPVTLTMRPVGEVPVRATVSLEPVGWGTRLGLSCTYDPESVDYNLPPAVDYTLVVLMRDGRVEQVGSWRSVAGRAIQFTAGTAASAEDVASVEVRTVDGRVVLTLAT